MSLKYLTNIDLNNNELQNSVIQNLATAPSSPKKGQIYFNTASNKAFVYNGTAWVPWEADTTISPATANPLMDGTAAVGTSAKYAREDHKHPSDTAKADKSATVSTVTYDSANKKITKTINGTTTDVVTVATLKTALNLAKGDVGLGNVDNTADANKSVASAAELTTARNIDGISFDGSANIHHYGTCETAAATAAKVATIDSETFTLAAGAMVFIKMTYANGVANPTLNVNSTGAKSIKRYGTTAPSTSAATSWQAGSVVGFVYDGSYWQMIGWLNDNTTYSAGTQALLEAGTDTSNRVWQAKILHDYMAAVAGSVDAMRFKGTIGTGGDVTELPTSGVKVGDTYRVITAGTYASQTCEIGDLIIAIATTPTWTVAQTNIDGAITSISGTAPISVSGTGSSRTITISVATQSAAGSMSAADKKKLDGIAAGAQVNPTFTAFTGNPTANQTPGFGGTFTISQIKQATGGQVSGTDRTVKIPDTEATPTQKGLMPAQAYSDLYNLAGNLTSMPIDGFMISPDDTIDNIAGIQRYAECNTAAGTAEKTVNVLQGYSLDQYCIILVKFKNTNTAAVANLKLNVNSTGAKPIKYRGGDLPSAGTLAANRIYWFVYDGTNYELVGDLDTNTTYSNKAAASGGTDVSLVTTGEKYTWNQKTSNTGTVTSVGSGTGLTGGPITTSGSLSLATVHSTAPGAKGDTSNQTPGFGSTFKVTSETVDAYGRTTALAEHTVKIPNAEASTSAAGLMSAADKTKLDGITEGASVKKYYAENPALTPSGGVCTWTVTHNLGTNVVDVRINEVDGGAFVMAEVIASSLNAVTIKLISNANIPASTYEAVVMG